MGYSADLEGEVPSINGSLHFEIKTIELVPLQVQRAEEQLPSYFFSGKMETRRKSRRKACAVANFSSK